MSEVPAISKSSRHSKITGDFAEHLTLYLLSKHGFECARVDHTGMDIIAQNPRTHERMGISVKSRSRDERRPMASMNVPTDNFKKLFDACGFFDCKPWFSFIIDRSNKISAYLLSLDTLLELYPTGRTAQVVYWAMNPGAVERYDANPNIYRWELVHKIERWWPEGSGESASISAQHTTEVAGAVQHADDFDAIVNRAVEDQIPAKREAA